MDGIKDLTSLLKSMSPEISDESFVFLSLQPADIPPDLCSEGTFREREGVTIICRHSEAEKHSFSFGQKYRRITLNVHSSLEAVGFLSAIARELTLASISCNVVSAYFHDHLFITEADAAKALAALAKLTRNASGK